MNEKERDRALYIRTTSYGERADQSSHYHHYEATSYWMLDELFNEYKLKKTDGFVDFGCGKGRVLYYVHNRFQAQVTGVEMNQQLYQEALENELSYIQNRKKENASIRIECCLAEEYQIEETESCFFLFNPFSLQIFMKVVNNILLSVERKKRTVDIILYYPAVEYAEYLETSTPFDLLQEVKVPGLSRINQRERFAIYRFVG